MKRYTNPADRTHRWYECKTCGKKYDTFQALGGHQGTHKKVKSINDDDVCLLSLQIAAAPVMHQCKMCPQKFVTGQALGGHMRRHKIEKDLILKKLESEYLVLENHAEEVWKQKMKTEEDDEEIKEKEKEKAKRELILAAKELRLGI